MEMMVVKPVVVVEVGADGLLPLWRKREKQSTEMEKCGGEDGCQADGDIGCG